MPFYHRIASDITTQILFGFRDFLGKNKDDICWSERWSVGCNAVVGIIEVWSQVPVHQLGKNTLGTESVSWTKMIYHLLEHWCSSSVCPYTKVQQRVTLCCEPWYMGCWATKEKHWSVKSLSVSSQLPHASAELRSSAMAGNTSRKWFWIRVPEFRGRVVWRPNCIGNLSRGREVSVTSRDQVSLRATWCPTDTSTSYALCSTSNRLLLVYLQYCLCAHVQGSRASGSAQEWHRRHGPAPEEGGMCQLIHGGTPNVGKHMCRWHYEYWYICMWRPSQSTSLL